MRYLITGSKGQLGHHLLGLLDGTDDVVAGVDLPELDITNARAVEAAVKEHRPDVLINAAAYTAVDAAETDEDAAFAVNAPVPVCWRPRSRAGRSCSTCRPTTSLPATVGGPPYEVDDEPDPRSAYGRTKLAGELAVRELLPDSSWSSGRRGCTARPGATSCAPWPGWSASGRP